MTIFFHCKILSLGTLKSDKASLFTHSPIHTTKEELNSHLQSPGSQPTLCESWCLIWWFVSNWTEYGPTWHRMSLLRPYVMKQNKTKLRLFRTWLNAHYIMLGSDYWLRHHYSSDVWCRYCCLCYWEQRFHVCKLVSGRNGERDVLSRSWEPSLESTGLIKEKRNTPSAVKCKVDEAPWGG